MSETKKLYRSRNKRMIAGVCAGLGEFFGVDPTLVRLAFVAVTLFGFPHISLPAYLIMMIVVPEEPLGSLNTPPPPAVIDAAEPPKPVEPVVTDPENL
jgi:phage shock protein C